MDLGSQITELTRGLLAQEDLFLIDVKVSGGQPYRVLITIDGDRGLDINTCAQISRQISNQLEDLKLMDGAFILEVSSPGLDHPLKLRRQYVKNIGRTVKVSLVDQSDRQGQLLDVTDDSILVNEEIGETRGKGKKLPRLQEAEILFTDIMQTKVLVSFKKYK